MGCEGLMDIDSPNEVGPTEETVEALMEYLVGPLLPLKHSDVAKDTPSESQQKLVAKQVHAAVVLYNYYHLNHNRGKEFLNFDQFCNLAIMFKPSILQHMRYMTQSNRSTINDPENQLSLTEKTIMDACTISQTLLDASSNFSNMIKDWPVTKVAVLLVDSKKENCFLQFNYGVWSVIEKDLCFEESNESTKKGKKRKLSSMKKYDEIGEAELQEVAFSAVKEIAGIKGKLKVLEGHLVYSLSQLETATKFYIVESTQSISEDNLVPIQDAISSLKGPVVRKISGSWAITPVVEYYYLLPYADIISKWFSRLNGLTDQMEEIIADSNIIRGSKKSFEKEDGQSKSSKEEPHDSKIIKIGLGGHRVSSDNLQLKSKLESKIQQINNSKKEETLENRVSKTRNISNKDTPPTVESVENMPMDIVMETENSNVKKIASLETDCSKQKDMNGSRGVESKDSLSEGNSKAFDMPLDCLQKEIQNAKKPTPLKVYHHEKRTTAAKSVNIKCQENLNKLKNMPVINNCKDAEKKSTCNKDRTLTVAVGHDVAKVEPLEDFNLVMNAKRSELSEAALRALLNKRQKLSNQQRFIEEELSICEKKIQAIRQGGIGDCLGLKLEAVIDCCNEICQQNNKNNNMMQIQDLKVGRYLPLSLSESSCEELDDICLSNNWMLPTYHMSPVEGGFVANVSVKGTDFECCGVSGMQQSIREARNSAATHVLTKLQQMTINHTTALTLVSKV